MDINLKQYEKLGPFEIKDFVAKLATKSAQENSLSYLNAGRGNPNWVATAPRDAFFLFGQFAVTESKRVLDLPPGVGGMPKAKGIAGRLEAWLKKHGDMPGASFLQEMVPWAVKKFGFDADTFVLGVPIFTPYLEMAHLEDYDLHFVEVHAKQEQKFQYPDEEIKKLLDPKVKAFFIVNPGNPFAVALSPETIKQIGAVLKKRPDLILLTDDVYGTFVPGFRSLMGEFPRNTLGVYSYSKYFGCTGWRLGTIAIHEDNIFDEIIAKHPDKIKKVLDKRYGTLTLEPRKLAFIDRIVADSRDVALNHTAGLSLPQQVMMTMFSLSELMDEKKDYQKACLGIVKKRVEATIEGLDIEVGPNEYFDYYYGLLDFEFFARKYVGDDIVKWMKANVHPLDIVFRLAQDHGIVLLNGGGFAAPDWSVRISFANLEDHVYDDIGRAVRTIARGYRQAYEADKGKNGKAAGKKAPKAKKR